MNNFLEDQLAEFHALQFRVCEAARRAGDQSAYETAAFLHDQFCRTRQKLDGKAWTGDSTYAAFPRFVRKFLRP